MQITARDIKEMGFSKKFNGYEIDEVRNFLEMVAVEYEKLVLENTELKEATKKAEREIEMFRQKDENLNKILLTAQSFAENERKRIQQESELRIKETELTIRTMIEESARQKARLESEVQALILKRNDFIRRYFSLMEDQKRFFSELQSADAVYMQQNETRTAENQSVTTIPVTSSPSATKDSIPVSPTIPDDTDIDRIVEEKIVEERKDIFQKKDENGSF